MSRPAIFLDRDGTLLHDTGYMSDAEGIDLLPGAGEALARIASAGYTLVVVTNQSGIARGLITLAQLDAIHDRVDALLLAHGVRIAAWEHCPHLPESGCDCRKPGVAMHRRAAARLDLDMGRSWCVGDRLADIIPAARIGAQGALVLTGEGPGWERQAVDAGAVAIADLTALADLLA